MKSILFIAPPAAGKGTQSKIISDTYKIPHISTGDLLRKSNNPEILKIMKNGTLVSTELTIELLKERLLKGDCSHGYILDGFPRTISQAHAYENLLKELGIEEGIVIVLELDKENSRKRIIGREVCPSCFAIYNELFEEKKSKVKGICDKCHTALIKRIDDNNETFENRYSIYLKETKPLIKYYEEKGIVYYVNSGINEDYTFGQIKKIIGGVNDKY